MKATAKVVMWTVFLLAASMNPGCRCTETEVPAQTLGRVRTPSGWGKEALTPGYRECWGRDEMYLVETTEATYEVPLEILTQDNINLKVKIAIRCGLNVAGKKMDDNALLAVFDRVKAGEGNRITNKAMFDVYVMPEVNSIPKDIISKFTIKEVMAKRSEIGPEVNGEMASALESTPMKVTSCRIINYDWPDSITTEQELLMAAKIKVERQKAEVEAELEKAKGMLVVEKANRAVEVEKAGAVAESNTIIADSLKDNPEYLQWHTVRVLSEAANGPNNAFILIPYGLPGQSQKSVDAAAMNMQLKQLLEKALKGRPPATAAKE